MATVRRKKSPASKKETSEPPAEPPVQVRKWLWFRSRAGGPSRAQEEFEELPVDMQAELRLNIRRYLSGTSRRGEVDLLEKDIYEIRVRKGNNHFRVVFLTWGPHAVGLTAFYKNQQKTPSQDLARARTRATRWKQRVGTKPARSTPDRI